MPPLSPENILSVSELTRRVRAALMASFAEVAVSGEISNFIHHASGHMYFSLKDEGAQISCVFFKGSNLRLDFKPENGMQAVAVGGLDVYPPRGNYQLKVTQLLPKGLGSLAVRLEQLKRKLEAEGLFDPARKQKLPVLPERVGIITSGSGAAIKDILKVGLRRRPGADVVLYPVPVEGARSAPHIARAIRDMSRWKICDVLIVGRGGGSAEDLWAFNEEEVCRAAYDCEIPLVSAVGHERDVSVLDLVADVRAATPSQAAEIVFPDVAVWIAQLEARRRSLRSRLTGKFSLAQSRLDLIRRSVMFRQPTVLLEPRWQHLDDLRGRLSQSASSAVASARERFVHVRATAEALSPLGVLKRGYSVLRRAADGKVVRRPSDVKAGARVNATLAEGVLELEARGGKVDGHG